MATWDITTKAHPHPQVCIRISGEIQLEDAADAARRVGEVLKAVPDPVEVVIDLRPLQGYPVAARNRWSEMLKECRSKVSGVAWVCPQTTYRMVARAVGLFTGIPTRVVDDTDELEVDVVRTP